MRIYKLISLTFISIVLSYTGLLAQSIPVAPGYVLCQSGTANSVTGTVTETILATCTLPANTMGANGHLEIISYWNFTGSTNSKILRVKLSTQSALAQTVSTNTSVAGLYNTIVWAANSTSSQISAGTNSFGTLTNTVSTLTVSTTADVAITLTGTLANTGETITLMSYTIKVFP